MGFKGFKVRKQYKAVNSKFNKMTNEKSEQESQKNIQENLDFMVAVGLLEKNGERYKEPEICKNLSDEQREFVLNVSKKSYQFALSEDSNCEVGE